MKKLIALLFSLLLIFSLVGCGDEPVEEPDANGWVKSDYATFMTITQNVTDNYLTGYKTPWGADDWKFTKFSTDVILAQTTVELKGTSEKQNLVCTFTWLPDTEEYKGHYLSVGDVVFLDDETATPHL